MRQAGLAILVFAAFMVAATPHGQAAPPVPGSEDAELMEPYADWIRTQYSREHLFCCTASDGRPLFDNEIRDRGGHYEVKFARRHWTAGTDEWIAVADEKIIAGGSPMGLAVAWISNGGFVYCLALPSRA